MSLGIKTQPVAEPVTVDEIKQRLKLATSEDDDYIGALITTAREFAEKVACMSLVSKTYTVSRAGFPWPHESIRLPVPPVSAINSVKYLDTTGALQTWDESEYLVGLTQIPAVIRPVVGTTYPQTLCGGDLDTVFVEFVAGPADAALQLNMSGNFEGIRQLAQHFYEHPSAVTSETLAEIPYGIQALLRSCRYNPIH